MATASKNSVESAVERMCECPVCLDTYDDPRSLPCGHSICRKCVDRCISPVFRLVHCPVCRTGTETSPVDFPINYALRDLVAQVVKEKSEKRICGGCSVPIDRLCVSDTSSHLLIRPIVENQQVSASASGSDSNDPGKTTKSAALTLLQTSDGLAIAVGLSAAGSSDSGTKRKLTTGADATDQPSAKQHTAETGPTPKSDKPPTLEDGIRYFMQLRPVSSAELVSVVKKRWPGMSKEELVQTLVDILNRLKPEKERRDGVVFWSLKKGN